MTFGPSLPTLCLSPDLEDSLCITVENSDLISQTMQLCCLSHVSSSHDVTGLQQHFTARVCAVEPAQMIQNVAARLAFSQPRL